MDSQQQLAFCAEMARQLIRASAAPEYVKETLELMLDMMPELASFSEETCLDWAEQAARVANCTPSEISDLKRAVSAIFAKAN